MNALSLLHLQKAKLAVAKLVASWPGAPKVHVVAMPSDVPYRVSPGCRGIYVPRSDEVYVVAGTQPATLIGDTLAHEVVAHHGLRAMLPRPAWVNFMHGVQAGARRGDWWLQQIREDVRNVYVDGSGQNYLSPVAESDEICAAAVESRFHGPSGRLRVKDAFSARCAAALGHVQREVLYQDEPVTFRQLLGTLLESEHRLRYGGHFWGIGYRLQRWYAPAMPKPWNPHSPPMSLDESNRLLAAEKRRIDGKEENKAMLQIYGTALYLLAFVCLVIFVALQFFGVLR